jgi:hypothetical protein
MLDLVPASLLEWWRLHACCDGQVEHDITLRYGNAIYNASPSALKTDDGEIVTLTIHVRCPGCLTDDLLPFAREDTIRFLRIYFALPDLRSWRWRLDVH